MKRVILFFSLLFVSTLSLASEKRVETFLGVDVTIHSDSFSGRTEYSAPSIPLTGDVKGFVMVVRVKEPTGTSDIALGGHAFYMDEWRHYKRAVFRGGAPADFSPNGRNVVSCSSRPCTLSEGFLITLKREDLKKYVEGDILPIQVRSERSNTFTIHIPVAHIRAIQEATM